MKKILLVVDYQNDFVDGALGFPKAKQLEHGIAKHMIEYLENGGYVICTYDTHGENYMNTQEGKKLPVPHCLMGSDGWKLYGAVGEVVKKYCHNPNLYKVDKGTFGSINLIDVLDDITDLGDEPSEIEICGVVTNMCVISNAIIAKTTLPEAEISIIQNLCASNDDRLHDEAINILKNMQFNIINAE